MIPLLFTSSINSSIFSFVDPIGFSINSLILFLAQLKAVSICKKVGLETTGYFMIGNPGETEEDALKTIKLSKKLDLDLATFGVTTAYPGTELYNWAIENNCLDNRFWYMKKNMKSSNIIRELDGNLNLSDFPPERQAALVKKANREFYFRPSYVLKRAVKIRSYSDIKRLIKSVKELL